MRIPVASPSFLAAILALGFVQALAAQSPGGQQPVVLDRVIAVINGDVILESDVQEEMRFAVLQSDRDDPARNTPLASLQRLIDRDLILQQMKEAQTAAVPASDAEVSRELAELRQEIPDCVQYHCASQAGWDAFLAAHELVESEVTDRWRQRIAILSFIQARFGSGVHIADSDIAQYYQKNLVPEFTKRDLPPPSLASVSSRIQEILLQQQVNSLLEDWLGSLKSEGSVSILDATYAGAAAPAPVPNGGSHP
ncbi:MAG TPA: peptidylprolyl isomerase [Acidobacteriaceae bacterium]|jgi:hypothetical protein|nr:peptidylprolyl isomerase [Acidobacteriaceae bacterium]